MTQYTPEFLRAVVDTLLPGLPATAGEPAVPPASQIGVDQRLADHVHTHQDKKLLGEALQAIVVQAGDADAFVSAEAETAERILAQVEETNAAAFDVLLFVVTAAYYQSAEVLEAFGWPARPPQPQGYVLPPFDGTLLAAVRKQPLWRPVDDGGGETGAATS